MAQDVADAIGAAMGHGGSISTLIVPHDRQIGGQIGGEIGRVNPCDVRTRQAEKQRFDDHRVHESAKALKLGRGAILLGGTALSAAGQKLAGRIAAATGAALFCDTFFARMERGAGLPPVSKLPYFPDIATNLMRRFERVVIAGTRRPVAFFGYPGVPSHAITEEQTVMLADAREDALGALEALAAEINAPEAAAYPQGAPPPMPKGPLDASSVSAVIARLQPANCIVMDEALTVGIPYYEASQSAPRFTHLMLTGGAIGQGPGAATGAAIACPDRKVINFQSDGCGAYSVQAFWTQAREKLDVVTIIGANRSYNILKVELERAGINRAGRGGAVHGGFG